MRDVVVLVGSLRKASFNRKTAHALRESLGVSLRPSDQELVDGEQEKTRAVLGEEAFQAAFAEGQSMTWEQAIDYALEDETTDGSKQ